MGPVLPGTAAPQPCGLLWDVGRRSVALQPPNPMGYYGMAGPQVTAKLPPAPQPYGILWDVRLLYGASTQWHCSPVDYYGMYSLALWAGCGHPAVAVVAVDGVGGVWGAGGDAVDCGTRKEGVVKGLEANGGAGGAETCVWGGDLWG